MNFLLNFRRNKKTAKDFGYKKGIKSHLGNKTKKEYLKELIEKDFDENYLWIKELGITSEKQYNKTKQFLVASLLS